jgi:hypothetical protein
MEESAAEDKAAQVRSLHGGPPKNPREAIAQAIGSHKWAKAVAHSYPDDAEAAHKKAARQALGAVLHVKNPSVKAKLTKLGQKTHARVNSGEFKGKAGAAQSAKDAELEKKYGGNKYDLVKDKPKVEPSSVKVTDFPKEYEDKEAEEKKRKEDAKGAGKGNNSPAKTTKAYKDAVHAARKANYDVDNDPDALRKHHDKIEDDKEKDFAAKGFGGYQKKKFPFD